MPLDALLAVVDRLRGEGGCPWDRAQDARSLLPYLVEETYELVDAVERNDDQAQADEIGDLLYLVLLLVRIGTESGAFDLERVERGIVAKMERRHPGLFSRADPAPGAAPMGSQEAWETHKAEERGDFRSALEGLPPHLPALLRAHRVAEKAARVGFDWPDRDGVLAKVDEERRELDEALASTDPSAVRWEYGDLLLALANLGRFLGVPGEDALREASRRFEIRFRALERLAAARGLDLHRTDLAVLERLWQEVKAVG
ncbi:MAG: nucleoside triphosphate pyrophosphohydrolase [Deltaproteobacteria bacterium]|nr:nucleoside triphosphate pyrophosphohydrolase [Deltaproteobacteria bacterium]